MEAEVVLDTRTRHHRLNVQDMRNSILRKGASFPFKTKIDLKEIDDAYSLYIKAYNVFTVKNSDETMINVIGTWARMTRILNSMEQKYGFDNSKR